MSAVVTMFHAISEGGCDVLQWSGDTYAFDMFIDPEFRGKNLATPIHKFLHSILKKEGFGIVYGYYWNDNLPALWMQRMLKFKELPKRWVSRFFYVKSFG